MKSVNIIFLVTLFSLTCFCSCNRTNRNITSVTTQYKSESICFDYIDSTTDEDFRRIFYKTYISNNSTFYAGYIIHRNFIFFYNGKGRLIKSDTLPKGTKIDDIYIVNEDSFYIFTSTNYDFNFYQIVHGKIKKQWKPEVNGNTVATMRTFLVLSLFHEFKVFSENNHLYCILNAPTFSLTNNKTSDDVHNGNPVLSLFNLTDDGKIKIDFSFASFKKKNNYHDFLTLYTFINDSVVAYGIESERNIYFYNIYSRKLIKEFEPDLQYFQENTPFNMDSVSPDYTNRYLSGNTRKYFLKYNPANKTLYCMYTVRQKYDGDTVALAHEGDFVLASIDPFHYKLKQEYYFKGNEYLNSSAMFFEDKIGLLQKENNSTRKRCYDIFSF